MTDYLLQLRPIFCLPVGVEIEDIYEITDWAFANPTADTILWFTNEQIENYYFQGVWENVLTVTDGFQMRASEDEWIYSFEHLSAIRENFKICQFSQDTNIQKIIAILDYAIEFKRLPVVFYF